MKKNKRNSSKKVKSRRNLYKKVGAATLAMLSLFGLGASVKAASRPSVARQKRKVKVLQKEQQKTVKKEVSTEVSRNVSQEMRKMSVQELQQEIETRRLNFFTKLIVYSSWAGAMGLLLSALWFNVPFALGLFVLELLPGEPHTVSLAVVSDQPSVLVGEDISIKLQIKSGLVKMNTVNAEIEYDPDILELKSIDYSNSLFSNSDENSYDNEQGLAVLKQSFKEESDFINAREYVDIATLVFRAKAYTGIAKVDVLTPVENPSAGNTRGSWAYGEEGKTNILTKVDGINFEIYPNSIIRAVDKIDTIEKNVILNGSFDEWGEVTKYVGFSNIEQGYKISYMDILDGHCLGNQDASINFFLGKREGYLFVGAVVNDDSFTNSDYLQVVLGEGNKTDIFLKQDDPLNLNEFVLELSEGTYVLEARVKTGVDFNNEDFNLYFYDFDEDGSHSAQAFSY